MIEPLEIDGTQPGIEGSVCEEMLAEELWHAGKVSTPANVVHLQFAGSWHRLSFDTGVVFWRESDGYPVAYDMPEIRCEVRIVDLGALYGIRGLLLERIETSAVEDGTQVAFHFTGSRRVCFQNVHDVTSHVA